VRTTAAPKRQRASVSRRARADAGATRSPRSTARRPRRPAAQIFDLRLATDDPSPVYQQLVDQLRLLVSTGELPPGSRVPSARHLAANLGVNRNTALRAYMVLAREGVFEGRRGGGTVVI
jgi:DNA-binding GntR family transcriptional regulator